jgi:hypothetical protein
MRHSLPAMVVSALLLIGVTAYADPAPPDLRGLLSIGTAKPQTNLRWGMGRAELQSLYPGLLPTTFAVGIYSVHGATTYRGCTFTLRLDSDVSPKPEGLLKSAHMDFETGNLEKCRRSLDSELTSLYGRPHITKHPAGFPDGSGPPATVFTDWSSPTSCIDLWWEDGEGRWSPSLRLTLREKGAGCGGYDDEVVTTGRPVNKD